MDSGEETVWQNAASLLEGAMETKASKSQPKKTKGTRYEQATDCYYRLMDYSRTSLLGKASILTDISQKVV